MLDALASHSAIERVYPSDANFVLVEVEDSAATVAKLEQAGIKVRDRNAAIPNTVRITVGTPEQNTAVINAL